MHIVLIVLLVIYSTTIFTMDQDQSFQAEFALARKTTIDQNTQQRTLKTILFNNKTNESIMSIIHYTFSGNINRELERQLIYATKPANQDGMLAIFHRAREQFFCETPRGFYIYHLPNQIHHFNSSMQNNEARNDSHSTPDNPIIPVLKKAHNESQCKMQ